jgi:uncharacterized protein
MKSQQPPLMNASFTADIVSSTATQRRLIPKRRLAALSRWLHIYLSMASFAILLFFAVFAGGMSSSTTSFGQCL